MALELSEVIPLVLDLNVVIQKGVAASKAVAVDASDVENACSIIAAVVPDLCALVIKAEKAAKS